MARPTNLLEALGRPIAFYPNLSPHVGGIKANLFLCQLMYWSDKAHSDLGVYKSVEEWTTETGLSYKEQKAARKNLESRGLIVETAKRLEHKIYFKLNRDALDKVLFAMCSNVISPTDKRAVGDEPKGQFVLTENTTETTTEITKQAPRSSASREMMIDLEQLKALGVEEQVAIDWLTIRKKKRAPLTETAINALVREAGKAGLSVGVAVQISAENGWSGFKASWDLGRIDEEPEIYAPVVEAYNRICGGVFTICAGKTKERFAQVSAMQNLEFMGRKPFSNGIRVWEQYFTDCLSNKYWRGENEKGWTADFDFVTRPANAIKLMERMN